MIYIVTIIIVVGFVYTLSLCKIAKKQVPLIGSTNGFLIGSKPVVSETIGGVLKRCLAEHDRNDTHLHSAS